jgi:hypothetical protein
MRSLLQLILLLPGLAIAQIEIQSSAPPSAANPDTAPQARVTGRVILADTHTPARNAAVLLTSLDGQNRQSRRVGMDGTYLFERVVQGEYILLTYLDGYLSPFDKLTLTAEDRTIASLYEKIVAAQGSVKVGLQGTQTVNINLERGAVISGRVRYSDGLPAIQAAIEIQDATVPLSSPITPYIQMGDMSRSEFDHRSLETDDQGRFRISGISPGVYRIAAVQLQEVPMQNSDSMFRSLFGALRYYTNGTVHADLATTYTIVAGQKLMGLEIRIPLSGFRGVQGKIVATDGRVITSANVIIKGISDPFISFSTPAGGGTFRFDRLPPGTYTVFASWASTAKRGEDMTEAFGPGATTFTIKDSDLTGVILTLPKAPLPPRVWPFPQ